MRFLDGSKVQRIDSPLQNLFVFTLYRERKKRFCLLSLLPYERHPSTLGFGLIEKRPHGNHASAFVRKMRKELQGTRWAGVEVSVTGDFARIRFNKDSQNWFLVLELSHPERNLFLLSGDNTVLVSLHSKPEIDALEITWDASQIPPHPVLTLSEPMLLQQGKALFDSIQTQNASGKAQVYRVEFKRLKKKFSRKQKAIEQDALRANQAPKLRHQAELLISNLGHINSGQTTAQKSTVDVFDWSVTPPQKISLPIDPALGPQKQADKWFHQARRFEKGKTFSQAHLKKVQLILLQIEKFQHQLEYPKEQISEAETFVTMDSFLNKVSTFSGDRHVLNEAPYKAGKAHPKKKNVTSERLPYRQFISVDGLNIRVGRSASDNDALLLRHSRPQDLWLHVRDGQGSHVLITLNKNQNCPPETLIDAASLAVHFSGQKNEKHVDVQYTFRKHVQKNRKLKPGQVLVSKEKVLHLQMEPKRIHRLLDRL